MEKLPIHGMQLHKPFVSIKAGGTEGPTDKYIYVLYLHTQTLQTAHCSSFESMGLHCRCGESIVCREHFNLIRQGLTSTPHMWE